MTWKSRLIVVGIQLTAVGLVAGWFFGVRPSANQYEESVKANIAAFGTGNVADQRRALSGAFDDYVRQSSLATALLAAAFVVGTAGVVTGAVLPIVETRRAKAAGVAAARSPSASDPGHGGAGAPKP